MVAAEHVRAPEVAEDSAHEALSESLQDPSYGADTLKHLRQNSALLAVLRDSGQFNRPDTTFVDLGSGKGDTLSVCVSVSPPSRRGLEPQRGPLRTLVL